jgi:DNA-binding transcriptional MerR regulator
MFKIGEFSTIARVSDVLLRHYDQIDLFKPAYVDPENGYRYYTIEQLPELNRILALRDLGFSLEQVGRLTQDNISLEEVQGMLNQKRAQIERSVAEEQARLRRVESRLKQIQQHKKHAQLEVVLKSIPGQPFLSVREPVPFIRKSGWLYYQVSDAVLQHQVPGLGYCLAIFHEPAFRERNVDFELGFLLNNPGETSIPLPDHRQMTVKRLNPIKQALTYVHTGPWSEIHLGFSVIGSWIETEDMRIAGRSRELYLNLVPPEEDDKLIVEIQIPVERRK